MDAEKGHLSYDLVENGTVVPSIKATRWCWDECAGNYEGRQYFLLVPHKATGGSISFELYTKRAEGPKGGRERVSRSLASSHDEKAEFLFRLAMDGFQVHDSPLTAISALYAALIAKRLGMGNRISGDKLVVTRIWVESWQYARRGGHSITECRKLAKYFRCPANQAVGEE